MSYRAKRYVSISKRVHQKDTMSKHHRKPQSLGGGNGDNVSELPRSKHEAWHTLFRDFSPERIAEEINERYLDPDWEMVAVKKGGKYTRGAE
jgi:hypothetical protein